MKRKRPRVLREPTIRTWPVFSAKMVAEIDGEDEADARARLDRLVNHGILARYTQKTGGPDVYYLAPPPSPGPEPGRRWDRWTTEPP